MVNGWYVPRHGTGAFFMSGFDIPEKIVVNADVPNLAPVFYLALPNVDALDKPQERGADRRKL